MRVLASVVPAQKMGGKGGWDEAAFREIKIFMGTRSQILVGRQGRVGPTQILVSNLG